MNCMARLLIVGPNGTMGRALVTCAAATPSVDLIAGIGPKGRDYLGTDLGRLVGLGRELGAPVVDSIEPVIDQRDVVLDCTRPDVSMATLRSCLEHKTAFVTGTTGFSKARGREMEQAGETIAVLRACNASPIVHLLSDLIRMVSQEVGADANIDIIEMHSRTKLDAPSGTAKEIGQIIANELGRELDETAEHGREGLGIRAPHTIQFSAIRSGGIPSTHKVIFGFQNERLELTHHAYTMEAFANGLIRAVLFVSSSEPGYFTLDDVL